MRSRSLLLLLALFGGCGDFAESNGSLDLTTVDAKGGAVEFRALTVAVPPAALDHAVTIRLQEAMVSGALSVAYRMEPADAHFAAPITVTFALAGIDVPHPAEVFLVDFNHSPPAPLSDRHIDAQVISGTTTAAGLFGLVRCPGGTCPH